jgi:TRAP-type transport system periplasmic protein
MGETVMNIQTRIIGLASCAVVLVGTGLAASASAAELKIAHFVTPKNTYSKWIAGWAKELEAKSKGELKVKVFPGAQMGPPPKYYDIARRGQADITWMVHGFTPGRFPLTEISNLPYMVQSGEVGAKMLNDPTLRSKYLDKEHKGVKPLILWTHQPGVLHLAKKAVRRIEDMKGLRIRFASGPVKDMIVALGATPVGMPPTQMAEAMQKGTIDGAFTDYVGAGLAFKLGPVTKYSTETYSYAVSFCLCMNKKSYDGLSSNLKKLIDTTMTGREKETGGAWDNFDQLAKGLMMKSGMKPIKLSAVEDDRFRAASHPVIEARLAAMEKKGLPAREVYKMMKDLATKHAKTSKNFWK